MYSRKRQAQDFLDKCRVISSVEQPNGFFVDSNVSTEIVLKIGYTENGEYKEDEIKRFGLLEILEEKPEDTVLNLKKVIRTQFGRKRFFIEESLYEFLKEINQIGYRSETGFEEDFVEDISKMDEIN